MNPAIAPNYNEKVQRLRWSYLFNATNSAFGFLTVFGTIFILFLDKLELPKGQIGLILSLFPFCGIVALVITPTVARFGLRKTFVAMWSGRTLATALLLLTPLVLTRFGKGTAFFYVAGVILLFALFRAVGETAYFPWMQEAIPDSIRGRFNAINNSIANVVSIAALGVAGYVISRHAGLSSFMSLIAAGIVFGIISIWAATRIPGGSPVDADMSQAHHFRGMLEAFTDRNFRLFLIGLAVLAFSTGVSGFIPLYLTHEIGITSSKVILLSIAASLGAMAGYLWGWASDRYGGKPVTLLCLAISAVFPILYILIPRHSSLSVLAAVIIMFGGGIFAAGIATASQQMMYVNLVPLEKNTRYMSLYYAWMGVAGGLSPIITGVILEQTKNISGHWWILSLNSYTPLLLASAVANLLAMFFIHRIKIKDTISAGRLAGIFVKGNPLGAAGSLLRYVFARKEQERVAVTEKMGDSGSPLSYHELLHALEDPSFNVRYEAVVSVSRTGAGNTFTAALIDRIDNDDLVIATAAAWALGKLGDSGAVAPLRSRLLSGNSHIKASAARALATLHDYDSTAQIALLFESEEQWDIKVAYASALGALQAKEYVLSILQLLGQAKTPTLQKELAAALAKLSGNEHYYVRLLREAAVELGSVVSHEIRVLSVRFKRQGWADSDITENFRQCAQAFASNQLESAVQLLAATCTATAPLAKDSLSKTILEHCSKNLPSSTAVSNHYILLALSSLEQLTAPAKH